MPPETIDDVIQALDTIVLRSWEEESRAGYFAALYRRVTRAVRNGLTANRFENPPLLERLDVVFAGRYLRAYEEFRAGAAPTRSWRVAFAGLALSRPLVVQQILAGINAHINFDLAIAAAETAPGSRLPTLKADFDEINALLAEQVATVEQELAAVSPAIGLLEKLGQRTQTRIINFSLVKARDAAWSRAERITAAPGILRGPLLDAMDVEVELLGHLILHPPAAIAADLGPIRLAESNDVRRIIEVLADESTSFSARA